MTRAITPNPASITILLLCLQLKKVTLGAALVLCFSIGLAMTLVLTGVITAIGIYQATRRRSGFGAIARRAPYLSSGLIILVGLYVSMHAYEESFSDKPQLGHYTRFSAPWIDL